MAQRAAAPRLFEHLVCQRGLEPMHQAIEMHLEIEACQIPKLTATAAYIYSQHVPPLQAGGGLFFSFFFF